MPLFSVRAELLPMKGHFFLFNAGTAPVVPFLPVYAKQLGFSSTLVGVIYTVLPMMGMLAKPITGAIADKLRCHKILFISFLIVSIISFFSMMYIPPIDTGGIKADLHCNVKSDVKICSKKDDTSVDDRLINEFKDNTSLNCKMECTVDERFIISVCTKWNMTQYCSQIFESSNVLGDSLGAGKSRLGYADKISFEKSTTLSPVIFQNLPKNLLLEAQLAPYHSYQVRNCVYIPLGKVKDIKSTDNTWHTPYCNKLTEASCQAICESSTLTDFGESFSEYVPIKHYQFWLFVTLMITSWVGMAVVVSIGDTICFGLLGDSPDLYGYQRLWGSVGWGLFSIIAGILVDKFSDEGMKKDYTPVFYMMAVLLILDIVVSLRIKDTERMKSHNILQDIGKLLMDARIMIFMIWCIVVGMCTAVIWNFLFWHLEDLAESSGHRWIKTLEGLIMCVQCFGGELPFFFLSGWIVKRLGHINTMSLVLFAFGIRFILYSLLINPVWCLPIELLNGLTFGLFYATMTSYASIVAPAGAEATIQGLVGAVFEGVGVSIGSFLAGVLFDHMKGATVFCIYGLVMLVISVLHICVQFYLTRRADIDISSSSKGINSARYASPNDAISMLAEQCELTNS